MKSFKKAVVILFAMVILFTVSVNIPARSARYMTNAKFIDMVIRIMDLEEKLPADADLMSVRELYKVEMEILARKGIYIFVGTDPGKMVRRRNVVNFLYFALVQNPPPNITDERKFVFLIKRGFLSTGDLDGIMLEKEIIKALNIPKIVTAITETYIAPGSAEGIKEIEVTLEVYEEPASPIY
ncbi:hypothetical protein KAI68_04985 [bacterium]|nr:hypothetical protein [bacterium]